MLCLTVPGGPADTLLYRHGRLSPVGSPLADLMAAASNAVPTVTCRCARAGGGGRGDMARLTARFNRMTAGWARGQEAGCNLTADVATNCARRSIFSGAIWRASSTASTSRRASMAAMLDRPAFCRGWWRVCQNAVAPADPKTTAAAPAHCRPSSAGRRRHARFVGAAAEG